MSLQQIKKDIQELKRSVISRSEPLCKVFIIGAKLQNPNEEEIRAYEAANPHTHVIRLYRQDCRKV